MDNPAGNPNSAAAVSCSGDYDRCTFEFSHEAVEGDPIELDRTIIHEWLHVAMRDMDAAVNSFEGLLAPQTWEVLDDRYDHEKEGFIERAAFLIERLHR